MKLTEKGVSLLGRAKRVLDSTGAMLDHAEALQGEPVGEMKIGLNTDSEVLKITDFFQKMRSHYPKLKFRLYQSSSRRVLKYLKTRDFDGGYFLGNNPHPEIQTLPLHSLNLVVAGPVALKDKLEYAAKSDIPNLPWVVHTEGCPFEDIIGDHFGMCKKYLCRVVEADDETMKSLVFAGVGLGLLYQCEAIKAEQEGKVCIWKKEVFPIKLSFAYLKTRAQDIKIQAILKILNSIWKQSP